MFPAPISNLERQAGGSARAMSQYIRSVLLYRYWIFNT
jgi:hypothetical protein